MNSNFSPFEARLFIKQAINAASNDIANTIAGSDAGQRIAERQNEINGVKEKLKAMQAEQTKQIRDIFFGII